MIYAYLVYIFLVLSQAVNTKAAIGEREGKVDNKTKIEIIKEEQRRIEEERKEMADELRLSEVTISTLRRHFENFRTFGRDVTILCSGERSSRT